MSDALSDVKRYLEERYSTLTGVSDWSFSEKAQLPIDAPTWIWQDEHLQSVSGPDYASGAAILDPEIGICLYLQIFNPELPVRQHVSRALQIRSQLLPVIEKDQPPADENGSWRVLLHWLVNFQDLTDWISEVAEIRQETAHFEEIPADAIVRKGMSWYEACENHGFARLLFELRSIMAKKNFEQIQKWQNADFLVSQALKGIDTDFLDPISRQCAKEVSETVEQVQTEVGRKPASSDSQPMDLHTLSIDGFRNIDHLEVDFRSPTQNASATVIQGPNGSGKSSVFEALCIAVAGTSERHLRYLQDSNRRVLGGADRYVTDYLERLDGSRSGVKLGLNERNPRDVKLANGNDAPSHWDRLQGVFFSQESAMSLVSMNANDLGTEIASSLSTVADRATELAQSRVSAAQSEQKDFNTKWGLRGNITRRGTVVEQIARRLINRALPTLEEVLAWLKTPALEGTMLATDCEKLAVAWEQWQKGNEEILRAVAANPEKANVARVLGIYLDSGNDLTDRTVTILRPISEIVESFSDDLSQKLEEWGTWLERVAHSSAEADDRAIAEIRKRESELILQLEKSGQRGRSIGERIKHFELVPHCWTVWQRS